MDEIVKFYFFPTKLNGVLLTAQRVIHSNQRFVTEFRSSQIYINIYKEVFFQTWSNFAEQHCRCNL